MGCVQNQNEKKVPSLRNMIIRWDYQCFLCTNPLNVHSVPENLYEWAAYAHYRFIYNPIPLFMNRMYLKYIGKRMRRVCTDCFIHHRLKFNPRVLCDRETGRLKMRPRVSHSLTKEFIGEWVRGMETFFMRDA